MSFEELVTLCVLLAATTVAIWFGGEFVAEVRERWRERVQ